MREGSVMFESEVEVGGADKHHGVPEFQKVHVDKELNLKGKICPYTFVESMLALEEMEIGEVLRVIVDYASSACDVPKSLTREGYEILEVSKMNETDWAIVVRNKEFEEG